jgi:hypothetical protein
LSGRRAVAVVLVLAGMALSPATASADWGFTAAYHLPLSPDHEHNTTFRASVNFIDGTGTNKTGTNGTGTNGTGLNGTASNGTGNQTAGKQNLDVTACNLVIEPSTNSSRARPSVFNMTRNGGSDDFTITLGPWPPGNEFLYHFEANLSDGTVMVSNSSWHRTPVLLDMLWHDSLDEAVRLAKDLNRPLLVFVYSDLDHDTRDMYERVFNLSGVLSLSAGFVCLRMNNDTHPDFGIDHHVRRVPSVLFLNATTGEERDRLEKPISGPTLEKEMKYVLGTGHRPAAIGSPGPGYRLEAVALGGTLLVGPAVLFIALRRRARSIH